MTKPTGISPDPANSATVLSESAEKANDYRLDALRDAANIGVADIEAGRYRTFESRESLREGLSALTNEALGVD